MEIRNIANELLRNGGSLWSTVECHVRSERVIVYAQLSAHHAHGVEGALVASQRVLDSVLAGRDWLAAVHWNDRLCRTFKSQRSGESS